MAPSRQAGQRRRRLGNGARLFSAALLGGVMTIVTGCSPATTAKQNHDPLHGIMTPPGNQPQPNGAKPASASQPQPPGIPAMPTTYSATNNASLASMQGPLGRPLAIDDQGRPAAPGSWSNPPTEQPFNPAPNPNPRIEPVPDVFAAPPPKTTPMGEWKAPQIEAPKIEPPKVDTPKPADAASSNEQSLSDQLQARGVLQQKRDVVAEGVRLTCYVSRGAEGGLRALEVTAADYSTAAKTMLQQLDTAR